MTLALTILQIIEAAAAAAGPLLSGKVGADVAAADALTKIVQSALGAYQGATGKPMDLSTLQPIEPVQ